MRFYDGLSDISEMSGLPSSWPTRVALQVDCLTVFGPLPAVMAAIRVENQLNLLRFMQVHCKTKVWIVFYFTQVVSTTPLHCSCVSKGQRRSENNEIIIP